MSWFHALLAVGVAYLVGYKHGLSDSLKMVKRKVAEMKAEFSGDTGQ